MTNPTPVVVSGLFGSGDFDIYPAPDPVRFRCLFFSNRMEIIDRATARGWSSVLLPYAKMDSALACSLQSKSVKYLGFLDDPLFSDVLGDVRGGALYFDHKFEVKASHVVRFAERRTDASIVIRSTPRDKFSIWDEVEDASAQERYLQHMPETKAYIDALLERGYSDAQRICNTGLIHYRNVEKARTLARQVLGACQNLSQPECQIFWALHSQKFADDIEVIGFSDPCVADIRWRDPAKPESKSKHTLFARARRRALRMIK